ncbi:hypothetical protein [Bradyrhizobium ivorense]|uniref:hypothetical protein n=1 Tax=Bradyrhizobium ivorense TaxID=2511166 RepID=UPI00155AF17D|nr:hypothetical protein [Bradyrhizobium ivorense]
MNEKNGARISEKIMPGGIGAVQTHGSAIPWLSFPEKSETTTLKSLEAFSMG